MKLKSLSEKYLKIQTCWAIIRFILKPETNHKYINAYEFLKNIAHFVIQILNPQNFCHFQFPLKEQKMI